MLRLAALASLVLIGCGESLPPREVVSLDADEPGGVLDRWRFSDGVEISALEIPSGPLVPGESFSVAFDASAPARYELAVSPPRAAGREVALGGPDAPPPSVPPDPRASVVVVEGQGRLVAQLRLQAPWHPRNAVLTVRRIAGPRTLPVVSGPRRRDGVGVLAVLDVEPTPTAAVAARATPRIDGVPDAQGWGPRLTLVDSLQGEPVARVEGRTEVAFAWDERSLYVAAWLPDRDLRGTFTARDEPIWKEEVFELFVFGDARRASYLELQVSPRGVQFDSRFERYRKGDEAWDSAFAAPVQVRGTIEQAGDRDEGWTTELAVPWSEICAHTEVSCPPAPGTTLRINTFRLERPREGPAVGLALSPTRVPDFHAPENSAVLELLP